MPTKKDSGYKIAFLGLSNAGKTSIIKSLTQEFDMLTLLKPTISVEREEIEFLGKNLVLWDFGGQEKYREQYLNKAERYFAGISIIYYVVDIQDPLVLVPNISYFKGIYEATKKYSPDAKYIFLFHKADVGFQIPHDGTGVQQRFLEAVTPLLDADKVHFDMYQTTIYRLLTIITAVSQPLFTDADLSNNANDIMKSFSETYGLLFSILFTENFFSIGYNLTDRFKKNLPEDKKDDFLQLFFKQLDPSVDSAKEISVGEKKYQALLSKFEILFGGKKLPFYVAIGYDEESVLEKDGLEIALNKLNENLGKIFMNIDLASLISKTKK